MKRILVVDDDPAVRRMLDAAISFLGHRSTTASSGVEAVEKCRAEKIDLVLADVQMPEMNGPEMLTELKRIDPGVVCCFMSASRDLSDATLNELGAIGFLPKPFTLEALQSVIASELTHQAAA